MRPATTRPLRPNETCASENLARAPTVEAREAKHVCASALNGSAPKRHLNMTATRSGAFPFMTPSRPALQNGLAPRSIWCRAVKSLLVPANRNLALLLCAAVAAVCFGMFALDKSGAAETDPSTLVLTPKYEPTWLPPGVRIRRQATDAAAAAPQATMIELALPGSPIATEVLGSPSDPTFRFAQAWPRVGDILEDDDLLSGATTIDVDGRRVRVKTEGVATVFSWVVNGTRFTATARLPASDIPRFVGGVKRVTDLRWSDCCSHAVIERISSLRPA